MNVIKVIPISKSVTVDTLSYFTSKDVPVGALVEVPLRKKMVQGIVTSVEKASDLKSELKSASFSLKKLEKLKSKKFFPTPFIETVQELADFYATSMGSVFDVLVPEYILKNVSKLKIEKEEEPGKVTKENTNKSTKIIERFAVQGDDEERYGTWKSLIRQEFAKKRSIFFLFPTIEECEYAFGLLEKGVEGYAFLLHGALDQTASKKKTIDTWNKIMKEEHPVIVVATGGFLSLPREDIETIVVEREGSRSYKILRRPFLDIRHVAETLSVKKGIRLFLADNFLRLETLAHVQGNSGEKLTGEKIVRGGIANELEEGTPFKFRSLSTALDTLVDMRAYKGKSDEEKTFTIFSDEVKNLIQKNKEESERMIILATRRGVAPSVVCHDCQNIVTCTACSSPVVLHKSKKEKGEEKTFFMCHRCGERRSAEEYCKICGSWKLEALGIGIDLIEERIRELFPDISIFRIDSDTVTKDATAHSIIQKFRSKPGSILIGTEMMLHYLHEKIENSAIVSLDALFSLPDFRIQEKILSILIRVRTLTSHSFIVQSRKADEKVFEYGLKGNMTDFYRIAIAERKKYNYPPFSLLIKLTLEGKKDAIVLEMEKAQTILEPYEVEVFPAFTHTIKGNYVLHGLIRILRERWIDQSLLQKLRSLSPAISIKVDPESLL